MIARCSSCRKRLPKDCRELCQRCVWLEGRAARIAERIAAREAAKVSEGGTDGGALGNAEHVAATTAAEPNDELAAGPEESTHVSSMKAAPSPSPLTPGVLYQIRAQAVPS